jgi:hypothetical protein
MWLMLWLTLAIPARAQQPAPVAAPPPAASSKIWIGRYKEFEDFLRTAPFDRFKTTDVGVLAPRHGYFAAGGLAGGAAVKNVPPGRRDGYFESYKSEIAAYKLDRLLQMDMVPPTVERVVNREQVSVQLWIESTKMLKDIQAQKIRLPATEAWNRQIYRQRVFDDLIANIDDNAGNLLIDPAWNLILIDHSRAFTTLMTMPFEKQSTRIDRPFFDRMKALDRETLKREIGDFVEGGAIDALLNRRDTIVKAFETLAATRGEAEVFLR